MAEALGVAASVIAIATLAEQVSSALSTIRTVRQLPGRIYALNNEITDFQVVLHYLSNVLEERRQLPDDTLASLPHILKHAQVVLVALAASVDRVNKHCVRGRMFLTRATIWWNEQSRLQAHQEDLHTVKASLNVLLGASHS